MKNFKITILTIIVIIVASNYSFLVNAKTLEKKAVAYGNGEIGIRYLDCEDWHEIVLDVYCVSGACYDGDCTYPETEEKHIKKWRKCCQEYDPNKCITERDDYTVQTGCCGICMLSIEESKETK